MAKDGEEMLTKEQQMYNKELENRKKEIIQLVNEGYIKNILLLNIITGGLFTDEEVGTETENDSLFTEQFNYGKDTSMLDTSMLDILDNIIIHAKEKKCQKDKSCTISFKKYRNKKRSPNKSNVHQKKKSLKKSSTKKSLSKTKKSLKKSKKVAKSLKKKSKKM
jgi:hypothetical protein